MAEYNLHSSLKQYLEDPQSITTYHADPRALECENNVASYAQDGATEVIRTIQDALEETSEAILRADVLDTLQFLLKQSHYLPAGTLLEVVDIIINSFSATADVAQDEDQNGQTDGPRLGHLLEVHAFLLQWGLSTLEGLEKPSNGISRGKTSKGTKSKAMQSVNTAQLCLDRVQMAFEVMCKVMKLKLSRLFLTTSERDTFISLLTRPTYLVLETETRVKDTTTRMHAFKVLCIAIKQHGHAHGAQTSIIQNLTYFEHLAEPMAEFLHILSEQYDHSQLAEDVVKEISGKEFSTSDLKGPKSVAAFVTRFSELAPRIVQRQVSYLARLLESEHYALRCAIIEVCGNLIVMLSQAGDDERNDNYKAQINAFFDVLEERMLDTNPYCRCRAIQVFSRLCSLEIKYPKRRQAAAELASRGLMDKSSHVRRYAIKLLGRLLATHPFALLHGGLLSSREWNQRLQDCEVELSALQPPVGIPNAIHRGPESIDTEMMQRVGPGPVTEEGEQDSPADDNGTGSEGATTEALRRLQLTRRYYQEALKFISVLHEATSKIIQLLGSKNKNEVVEAMDFFVIADAYHIEIAKQGIRRMLRLIWTKGNSDEGKGVQSHLVDCYKALFFEAPSSFTKNDAANYIARNMISLTFGATSAELTSLEQLLATMMRDSSISETVVQKLWQVYGAEKKDLSKQQRRGAIIVLGMLGLADSQIIVRELETCLRIGLGAHGRRDMTLARYTCVALMRMTDNKPSKGQQQASSSRLRNDHTILEALGEILQMSTIDSDWYGFAEQAIGTIYVLAKNPDALCSIILRERTKVVFASKQISIVLGNERGNPIDDDGDVDMSQDNITLEGQSNEAPASQVNITESSHRATSLSQLLFLVGHTALKQIIHLELCEADFKRRKAAANNRKVASTDAAQTASATTSLSDSRSKTKEEEERDELDAMAGNNEDDFADAIAHVRERELLFASQALLHNFGPLVREICLNNTLYNNDELQSHAALCMAKLMCVSSEYCEANLGLLITILERSSSSIVRSNLVVALGDMAVCFNHLIDENTDYLYKRLADPALTVRRTCLMTLTFLVLAGQVKVKGQLGVMAKCVEDADDRIRELSRMFFSELSGKDNAIYNNFVDIFSLLSADPDLQEEKFRKIVKFLTGFIEKDKHAKQLAGKLAPRLARAESNRQWHDVAYALGLLPHKNEEITKLIAEGPKVVASAA